MPGSVHTQVAGAQVVEADVFALHAAGKALDAHVAFKLAHIDAGLDALVGIQIQTCLEAGQVTAALGADGALLADLGIGAQNAAPDSAAGACVGAGHGLRAFIAHALAQIAQHGHVLTPGRYVGAEAVEEDDEAFADKMQALTEKLGEQMAKGAELDQLIRQKLGGLGYEF